jgi:hypothetical protein
MFATTDIGATALQPPQTWSDWAAVGSLLGSAVILLTVVIAALQIRIQMRQFARERAFDSYFRFTKTFSDISHDFHRGQMRFRQNDRTLDEAAAENYYRRYWHLQLQQWELFAARLMPFEIYVLWMLYAVDYFREGRDFEYYDESGRKAVFTFADAFERIGKRVLRNQGQCRKFFEEISAIAAENEPSDRDETRRLVEEHVRRFMRSKVTTKRWKL